MDWQPIETAPQDGTYILGCNRFGVAMIVWKKWRNKPRNKQDNQWVEFTMKEPVFAEVKPTHWMPLPAPPSGA